MSCFERSLLEPNSARLSPRPDGNIITQLIPGQRSPRVFPGLERGSLHMTDLCTLPTPSGKPHTRAPPMLGLSIHQCLHHEVGPYWPPMVPRAWPISGQPMHPLSATPVRPPRRQCNCGKKTPPVGTRVSCFERSLLEPNSARM